MSTMKFGSFAWYDLMTTDTAAAADFYRRVFGWSSTSVGSAANPYFTFALDQGVNVGGLMPMPADAGEGGAHPCWSGYILVDDVDAYVTRVSAAGGRVYREPQDVPGMLRYAVVGDPHGAAFVLFKGYSTEPAVRPASNAIGNVGWHELHAGDGESDFAFYAKLFGWTKMQDFDMGPMGVYRLFTMGGGEAEGGVMTKMPDTPAPFWIFYFNVDGIDAAEKRVTDAGGKIMMGAHQVPTGQWISQCTDPQGAWFAMLAEKR